MSIYSSATECSIMDVKDSKAIIKLVWSYMYRLTGESICRMFLVNGILRF